MKKRKNASAQWIPSMMILVVMFALTAYLQGNLLSRRGLTNLINSYFPLVLMAIGQMAVMVSGCIDLSNGSALSLISCVLAVTMNKDNPASGWAALGLAVLVMVITALMNGFIVGYMRVPPVIATFATSYMYMGAALYIMPRPGGACVNWMQIFYRTSGVEGIPEWIDAFTNWVPPIVFLVLLLLLVWRVLKRTSFGRYLYATGSNESSAYFSGIPTARVRMGAYLFNAFAILLAALFFVAQNQSADYSFGDAYTLKSIAAAVIGGVAMSGGRGDAAGALIGALILSMVSKLIFFSGLPTAYQTLVNGLIVILALMVSYIYIFVNRKMKEKEE